MLTDVIIVGAGQGRRLGAEVPKVLLPLGAHPVFMHSVAAFSSLPEVDGLVLVVPAGEEERVRSWCVEQGCAARVRAIVSGGARRQDSVAIGLARVAESADIVLVHDAARPFVSADLIRRVRQAAISHGAAIPGIPVTDTLKTVAPDGRVVATVDRQQLVRGVAISDLAKIVASPAKHGAIGANRAGMLEPGPDRGGARGARRLIRHARVLDAREADGTQPTRARLERGLHIERARAGKKHDHDDRSH